MRKATRSLRSPLRVCLALATLVGLGAAASADEPPASEAKTPPTWYAQALSRHSGAFDVTYFWSKGPRLRAETVVAGHKVVTIVNGGWYTIYDALAKRGRAIERQADAVARDRPDRRPFANELEFLLEQGAEKIREDNQFGHPTEVYQVTDGLGRRELWITADAMRLPLHFEIYDRKTSTRSSVDYIDWARDLDIPDGFFEPEAGIQLERLSFAEYLKRSSQGGEGRLPVFYPQLLFRQTAE